jgi:peptide deformylase
MNAQLVSSQHPALTTVCEAVKPEDFKKIVQTSQAMSKLMRQRKGVGLAAPQIGDTRRFFVWELGTVINPEILSVNEESIMDFNEGCLSYPGVFKNTRRFGQILVRWFSVHGTEINKELKGMQAIVFQHELDHLNGKCAVAP